MKSKALLGFTQMAVVAAIGVTQLGQVPRLLVNLAQRTAAPLEKLICLGATPSEHKLTVPAAQPSVEAQWRDAQEKRVRLCERTPHEQPAREMALPVRIAAVKINVMAAQPQIETIADSLPREFVRPRLRRAMYLVRPPAFSNANAFVINQQVQIDVSSERIQAEIARAQAQLQREMRRMDGMSRERPQAPEAPLTPLLD